VPRAKSARFKALGEPARVWDGGEDGLDVIRSFWAAARERGSRLGTILLGFNRSSVSEVQVVALAHAAGFTLIAGRKALHPGTAFVFEPSAISPEA